MSETNTPPGGSGVTPPPEPPKLIAGKFKDEAAFQQGFREIQKSLGLPDLPADKPVFGDGTPFATLDAAVGAYKHFEGLYGRRQVKPPAAPTDPLQIKPPEQQALPDDADVNAIVTRAGLKGEDIRASFAADGKCTDEQYAALKKQGIPKAAVDQYLRAQTVAEAAVVSQVLAKAEQFAGGKEQLENVKTWMATNIPADELEQLNAQVKTNPAFFPVMIQIGMARKSAGLGASNGTMTTGSGTPTTGITTKAEWRKYAALAERGDAGAIALIKSTPMDRLSKLTD